MCNGVAAGNAARLINKRFEFEEGVMLVVFEGCARMRGFAPPALLGTLTRAICEHNTPSIKLQILF